MIVAFKGVISLAYGLVFRAADLKCVRQAESMELRHPAPEVGIGRVVERRGLEDACRLRVAAHLRGSPI